MVASPIIVFSLVIGMISICMKLVDNEDALFTMLLAIMVAALAIFVQLAGIMHLLA